MVGVHRMRPGPMVTSSSSITWNVQRLRAHTMRPYRHSASNVI